MAKENREISRFTPAKSTGLWDINPQMFIDATSAVINPFSESSPWRDPDIKDRRIREELKPGHIEEFADYILKGGNRQWLKHSKKDKAKTYQNEDNPLIKEVIMFGEDIVNNRIIRNNFYGLGLDDRKLISEAYVNFSNRAGIAGKEESDYSDETKKNIKKLKDARIKFEAGDIEKSELDSIRGASIRNLQEENLKSRSRALFADPNRISNRMFNPYSGREESQKAAFESDYGPFAGPVLDLLTQGELPRPENYRDMLYGGPESRQGLASLQAQYGFSPELSPADAGAPITGHDREYFEKSPTYETIFPSEPGDIQQKIQQVLAGDLIAQNYIGDDVVLKGKRELGDTRKSEYGVEHDILTGYRGPEGTTYDPEKDKYYREHPVYGDPTFELPRYKYDPRFIELLNSIMGPEYAEQFKKIGGVVEGRSPYQNKGEVEVEEKVEVKEEDSGNINLLDRLRRWWDIKRHFENMPEEEVDYSKVEVEESEETKGDREKDKEIIEYLEKVRTNMNKGGLSGQAQDVAKAGRYGDTMLMHVNPAEVQGLKSLGMPITTNPQTGQPEAFLPLIGALLGSMGVFGGVAPWLTGALGSGILSGVGSLLQGDSAKEAILTGLGSAALGKLGGALGGGSEAATEVGLEGASQNLVDTIQGAGVDLTQGPVGTGSFTAAGNELSQGVHDIIAKSGTLGGLQGNIGELSKLTNLDKGVLSKAITSGNKSAIDAFTSGGLGAVDKYGEAIGPTFADAKEGFSLKNLYGAATRPDVFLPAAIGGGGLSMIKSQEDFERLMREYQEDRKRRRAKSFADNPEQVPYGSQWGRILGVPPRPVSGGGRMGFFGGGLGSLGQIPQPLGGYTTSYADRPAINMPPYNENLVMGRG
mgnify:CR=1 FL=1